jgi:hypothetical protein
MLENDSRSLMRTSARIGQDQPDRPDRPNIIPRKNHGTDIQFRFCGMVR